MVCGWTGQGQADHAHADARRTVDGEAEVARFHQLLVVHLPALAVLAARARVPDRVAAVLHGESLFWRVSGPLSSCRGPTGCS